MKHINHKGFSLLEILLTITLLSILFAILVNSINPNNILSGIQDNQREADALTIYQALEQYALKNNTYPEAIKNMPNNSSLYICKNSDQSCINSFGSNKINLSSILVPIYMSKIPEYSTDTNNSGFYVVKDTNSKIGIGGIKRLDGTTFIKGLDSQAFNISPLPIVENGLVLYLDAGRKASYQGTGNTWFDLSGNNNNGTLINNPTYSSENGGSIVFDGVNDYMNSSFTTTSGQAVTYAGWLYSTETTSIYKNFVDSGNTRPMIWWDTSGRIEFDTGISYTTPLVYRNQWVYVVLSKPSGSSSASYYVNGVLAGTGVTYTTPALTPTWFNRGGGQTWKGNSSIIQTYNRALAAEEIQQNFNATKGRFGL